MNNRIYPHVPPIKAARLKLTLILLALLFVGRYAKADIPCATALDRCTMQRDELDSVNNVLKAKIEKQQEVINELQSYSNEQREAITDYLKKYDANGKRKFTAGEIFGACMIIFCAICGSYALCTEKIDALELSCCALITAVFIIIDLL